MCADKKQIGGYTLEGVLLGEGNNSKVVLATDPHGDKVAIKIVNKAELSDASRRLLDQEIRILKKLSSNSTFIIKLVGVIDQDATRYVIQEYIDGGDLFEYVLQQREELCEKKAKRLFWQMCKGVQFLHQKGIVHHDLKLENTGLRKNGSVVLMDFGFCTEFTPDQLLSKFCGTVSYCAPELLLGKPYPPTPVDVWALGVSLFVMLAKRFPFDNENPDLLYKQATSRDYIQSLVHSAAISDDARDLLMKIFVANPYKRISVSEMLRHKFFKGAELLDGASL